MMDFGFIEAIGWRDIVLVVAAVIGVYLVLSVMRLFQVAAKPPVAPLEQQLEASGWQPLSGCWCGERAATTVPPAAPVPEFGEELARFNVEVEVKALRRECAQLREELARMSEDMARLKVSGNASPLYSEAMVLARQGMAANGIAGHCGISIGEAELVAALARGTSEFERHEQGEDRDERNTESGNRFHG
jgi:hypothetical protein